MKCQREGKGTKTSHKSIRQHLMKHEIVYTKRPWLSINQSLKHLIL